MSNTPWQIDIDPEAINQLVVQTLLQSSLGEYITKELRTQVEQVCSGYDSAVERAIRRVISDTLLQLMREEFSEQIRAALRAKLSDSIVQEFVDKLYEAHWRYIERD